MAGPWFAAAVFLASLLLFVCEPMAAKQLLPVFGGSASVWLTCLVFFQAGLLGGYGYAHWMRRPRPLVHTVVLLAAVASAWAWALGGVNTGAGVDDPVLGIFLILAISIGLPFLVLGSTSPLMQVWFVQTKRQAVPYRLFALSNLASLLALLLYPTVIEPHVTLKLQRMAWAAGVTLFAAISAALAWRVQGAEPLQMVSEGAPATTRAKWLWFLLPMVASMQLSAVTGHLTNNVAAIPLLWVLPLAAYLLTFIVAFEMSWLYRRWIVTRFLLVMLASLAYFLVKTNVSLPIALGIGFFLVELFAAGLFCHAETYALRPRRADETTIFYVLIAAGGVAGSLLAGIVAPLVFRVNYDLALAFLATALIGFVVVQRDGWAVRLVWATGSVLMALLVVGLRAAYYHDTLMATRNFYGSLRVQSELTKEGSATRVLMNGTIEHGSQIFTPELSHTPTTYYAQDSGIGVALRNCCGGEAKRIGVVGLGVGTLAAYGRTGDSIRFYEINPSVQPVAENLFTYLRDSPAKITFSEGDARNSLEREPHQHFNVLVIDAFSGDAIPLHLLTVEAMQLYRRRLLPGGVLAFHVSNLYVNLPPEIAELARAAGMESKVVTSYANEARGEFKSVWVLVGDADFFARPELLDAAAPIDPIPGVRAWTDDFSSLLPLMRW